MSLAQAKVNLFHIVYNEATRDSMPPGYQMLDNMAHERDDWREYWPIRRFLLDGIARQSLDEDAWYGFFSPRFIEKTGLTAEHVAQFVRTSPPDTDVTTFSPQPDMGAFFLSIFEQEELFQPGFIAASEAFLAAIGTEVKLATLVMDSRQIVFSNYIVARPAFWRRWLEINEQLFAICEGAAGPQHQALQQTLTDTTAYPGAVPRKVFLMERIASLILTLEPKWKVRAYNTFDCAWSASRLNEFRDEAVMSDALKIAMREQGFPQYFAAFSKLRDKLR
jgi:hypothetical protein